MMSMFNLRRVISRIDPGTPLPDLQQKFDLVTAHRVCFHRIRSDDRADRKEWSPDAWKFSLLTTSKLDFSNRMAGYSWILIPARTALHFLPPSFAPAFCHKAHASSVRKRSSPPIQSVVHDSNKQRGGIEGRDASPTRLGMNARIKSRRKFLVASLGTATQLMINRQAVVASTSAL